MKKSLIIGKRQFLLAALVLILALAVYLNWRLSFGGSQNVTDVYENVPKSAFEKGYVVIKKGKKKFHKAVL